MDNTGNLLIADGANNRVRKVSPAGVITTLAGTGDGGYSGDGVPAVEAKLFEPEAVAVDGAGNVFVADSLNHRIRKISPSGIITTMAGSGVEGDSGDGGPAVSAQLNHPSGIAVDRDGSVFITDNNRIRKITSNGIITTIAGTDVEGYSGDGGLAVSAQLNHPGEIAVDRAGNLYVADAGNNAIRLLRPSPSPAR